MEKTTSSLGESVYMRANATRPVGPEDDAVHFNTSFAFPRSTIAPTNSASSAIPAVAPFDAQETDEEEESRRKKHKRQAETLCTMICTELDPRSIVKWPSYFVHSVAVGCQVLATVRFITMADVIAGLINACAAALCVCSRAFTLYSDAGANVAGPDFNPTIFLATMAGIIKDTMIQNQRDAFESGGRHRQLSSSSTSSPTPSGMGVDPKALLATILAMIMVASATFGVFLYVLGRLKISRCVQLVPGSVLAGFMACIGYLVAYKAIKTTMTHEVWDQGPSNPMFWAFFLPSLPIGILMYMQRRYNYGSPVIYLPLILITPLVLFFVIVYASGSDIEQARLDGWLFASFASELFYSQWVASYGNYNLVDWGAVGATAPTMVTMMIIVAIEAVLKQATTRKILKAPTFRIDHELMLAGKANILASLFTGVVGYPQPKLTYINYGIQGNSTSRVSAMGVFAELMLKLTHTGKRTVLFTGLTPKLRKNLPQQNVVQQIHPLAVRKLVASASSTREDTERGIINQNRRCFDTLDRGMEFVEDALLEWSVSVRERWFHFPALQDFYVQANYWNLKHSFDQILKELLGSDMQRFFDLVQVKQGWTICKKGDYNHNLYVLTEGSLTVLLERKQKKRHLPNITRLQTLRPGAFVNEDSLYEDFTVPYTVVADVDSTVLALSREGMNQLERQFPLVSIEIHRRVLNHSNRSREKASSDAVSSSLVEANTPRTPSEVSFSPVQPQQPVSDLPDLEAQTVPPGSASPSRTVLPPPPTLERQISTLSGTSTAKASLLESTRMLRTRCCSSPLKLWLQAWSWSIEDAGEAAVGAIYHHAHTSSLSVTTLEMETTATPVVNYCLHPDLLWDAKTAFYKVTRGKEEHIPKSKLNVALAGVGLFTKHSFADELVSLDDFLQLAVGLNSPPLRGEVVARLYMFFVRAVNSSQEEGHGYGGGGGLTAETLNQMLPGLSPLACGRFCQRVGSGGRVEAAWRELNNNTEYTHSEDVAAQLGLDLLQCQEMIWEADLDVTDALSLFELLETLSYNHTAPKHDYEDDSGKEEEEQTTAVTAVQGKAPGH
ncbi:hypothetical protein BASA81_003340 [Batrachochytrium salamandrivorans]|nr:hypothetical protein BASA81_003340 [Batrachochytrium salamandrivorans]